MAIDTAMNIAATALQANQFRLDVSANNVANINTDGFTASTVQTTDRAYINDIGQGTRVASTAPAYAPAPPTPAAAEAGLSDPRQSNTEAAAEIVGQRAARDAYGVNAAVFRAASETTQALIDLKG